MLVILYVVFSWISCIYGTAIDAVQESVLTTAELKGLVPIVPSETCSLVIWVSDESIALDLVKEVEEVEERTVHLRGQKVTCMLRKDEAAERYVDDAIDAEAIIISRTTGGTLDRKMVVHFRHEARTYILEPDWSSFIKCRGKEEGEEPLASFDIFGEIHFLYEDEEDDAKATSEEVGTTTDGGPVDPPEPPIFLIVIIICGLILFLLVAFCIWRCCCRCPSYNSM